MPTVLSVSGHTPQIDPGAFLAATATVVGRVQLAAGVSVWYGTVLRAESSPIVVGADTNLQDGIVVHTDPGSPVTIGARVTVGHRAIVHGARVDDDALIGMGAIVLNDAHVGAGAVIAAGAVVRQGQHIPSGSLAAGVPATVLDRPVPAVPRPNVASYRALADEHRRATP